MRVVIADDSSIMRTRALRILTNAGYNVVGAAENGPQAIALCAQLRPDLVVLDITMPGGAGDIAAHAILDAGAATFVLIASNQGNDAVLGPLKARGVGFCGKPFEAHKLLAAIARLSDGAR